jgi:hypothetical protein
MPFDLERAMSIIGKPRSEFDCNNVVNYVLTGDKHFNIFILKSEMHRFPYGAGKQRQARDFKEWGIEIPHPRMGAIIVGDNGAHVGIFIDSNHFIHSSTRRHSVVRADLSQLPHVFEGGYKIRYQP